MNNLRFNKLIRLVRASNIILLLLFFSLVVFIFYVLNKNVTKIGFAMITVNYSKENSKYIETFQTDYFFNKEKNKKIKYSIGFDKNEKGLKIKLEDLNKEIAIKPFFEDEYGNRFFPDIDEEVLPFYKINENSYKFSINVKNVPSSFNYLGLIINTSLPIETNEKSISVFGNDFALVFDFSDIRDFEFNISENEIKINISNLRDVFIDPTITFTTEQVESLAVSPLDIDKFVIAWCDEVSKSIKFKIYSTTGQVLVNDVVVDTSAGITNACDYYSVSVAALNNTHFAIAWFDAAEQDTTFAVYDYQGILRLGPIDEDIAVGTNSWGVSVSAFNSTHIVIGYYDYIDQDATFSTWNLVTRTRVYGPFDVDTGVATDSYNVHVAALNSTHFVFFYYDAGLTDDATFAVYTITGANVVTVTDEDTNVGNSYSLSLTVLNSSYFVLAYYDASVSSIIFSIRNSAGALVVGPITEATNVGTSGAFVSVAALNDTHFVIAYYDNVAKQHKFSIYNWNTRVVGPISISSSNLRWIAVTSRLAAVNISICNQNWIVAYVLSTTQSNFSTYTPYGTIWDGYCFRDTNPPKWFNLSQSLNNPGLGSIINLSAFWVDDYNLSYAWLATNETGYWENKTGFYNSPINLSGNLSAWSNFTWINYSIPPGTKIAWRIYANDSFGNVNFTDLMIFEIKPNYIFIEWDYLSDINSFNCTYTFPCYVKQYSLFNVISNVYCYSSGIGGSCFNVTGYLRNYSQIINNYSCINLNVGSSCKLTWSINASGNLNDIWSLDVFVNSTNKYIPSNQTQLAYIKIVRDVKKLNINVFNESYSLIVTNFKLFDKFGNELISSNTPYSRNLEYLENYSIQISSKIYNDYLIFYIHHINISNDLNLTIQIVKNYSGYLPKKVKNVSTIIAFNDTNISYSYSTIYIPKEGLSPNKILHCTNWNFVLANCSSWEILDFKDLNAQENYTHVWFNVTKFEAYALAVVPYLEVYLYYPIVNAVNFVVQNYTFWINASLICRGSDCEFVNATVRYNASSLNPDTPIPTNYNSYPFFIQESFPSSTKSCGYLYKDQQCNVSWIVNATGNINTDWKVGVLFYSSLDIYNHTDNATIRITGCIVDVRISFTEINFGNVLPNTKGNPSLGNNNLEYNITLGPLSCTLDLYIKGTDLYNPTYNSYILVSNITFSNSTNNYLNSYRLSNVFQLLAKSLVKNSVLTTFYWIDVPPIYAGIYFGNITIKAVLENELP
ncbi:MAG: hypothetical protein QW197_01325 [Candidatus Aenigmatarchaeota archaeon]